MTTPNPLIARFAGEPALIEPTASERFAACLSALAAHGDYERLATAATATDGEGFWFAADDWRSRYRPYVVKDGVLQIPVKGVLLHDFPFAFGSWATGYAYIQRAFERGVADYRAGNIKGIALVEDSPGGMVAGCFDAVDRMHALRVESGVPVRAFAHEMAYSAAYAIACAADHVAVSRTGGVGSIGVVTMHIDVSQMLDQAGIRITFIHAGKHKVDGNPYEALPDSVKARIQERIDALHQVFVSAVARGRGMEEAAVRATEALTFTASQAVSNGLADSIGSLDDAVAAFVADLSNSEGEDEMSTQDKTGGVDQAAIDAARAEGRAEAEREAEAAVAEARAAERDLIFAIIDSEEGKKRPAAARALAAEGGRTLDQATAFLVKLPEEQQPSGTGDSGLDDAMNGGRQPDVGAIGGGEDEQARETGRDVLALAASCGIAGFTKTQG